MNYYDGILVLIPSLLIGGGGVSVMTGISIQTTILVGAFIGVFVIGHGLFVNPPVDSVTSAVPNPVEPEKPASQETQKFGPNSVVSDD